MGIIAMVTPRTKTSRTIPRVEDTSEDVAALERINIHHFLSEQDRIQSLYYWPIQNPSVTEPSAGV